MSEIKRSWICCQIGAREHYSTARALQRAGCLDLLITDLWTVPNSLQSCLPNAAIRQRHHSELQVAPVASMNWEAMAFEAYARIKWRDWDRVVARNHWFEGRASCEIKRRRLIKSAETVVFSYSYAARKVFQVAKEAGCTTILGQIDAGPVEDALVGELNRQADGNSSKWKPAPSAYWDEWREECKLADHIVVNSRWSHDALCKAGIEREKLHIVPLAYEQTLPGKVPSRDYPPAFSVARPLRVLFLGQVNRRKGIDLVFDAIPLLAGEPVEIRIVGPLQVPIPDQFVTHGMVHFLGSVSREDVAKHYQWADIFLFPTFSDGFGLTQLEAQAWKLPILASRFCGDVVHHDQNGVLLEELSGKAIAEVIRSLLRDPQKIKAMSERSGIERRFTIPSLAESLTSLARGERVTGNV